MNEINIKLLMCKLDTPLQKKGPRLSDMDFMIVKNDSDVKENV